MTSSPGSVIDLNADLGESFGRWTLGDDAALLPLITNANVACGFHAGDPLTLRRSCVDAATNGVVIGAQVSYPDLPSEGLVRGAVQVPASGQPLVFLADHPVTGGYPVIAVVTERSCDAAAQLRPGDAVRFQG